MKNCQLITLSGLDGSGKSTQIELLKKYLESQGKTFFYFHAVEFSIGNKILKRGKNPPQSPFNKGGGSDSVTKANWLQIQLRKLALMVDVCRFNRLRRKLNVDYIISDRYFYDSVVNICYLSVIARSEATKQSHSTQKRRDCFAALAMTTIEKYIPRPDFAFYIDVKPETIMQRERKPDQGTEYLAAKEKLFAAKTKDWDMIAIDGERRKEEIFGEIKSKIHV